MHKCIQAYMPSVFTSCHLRRVYKIVTDGHINALTLPGREIYIKISLNMIFSCIFPLLAGRDSLKFLQVKWCSRVYTHLQGLQLSNLTFNTRFILGGRSDIKIFLGVRPLKSIFLCVYSLCVSLSQVRPTKWLVLFLLILKFRSQEEIPIKKGGLISSICIDCLVLLKSCLIIITKSIICSILAEVCT